jgi:DNA processing protein
VHQLLRTGAATLVTSGAEVLEVVSPSGDHLLERPRGRDTARDRLTQRHRQVLDAVPVAHDVAADSIARTAGMGLMEVRSALTRLDALGLVESSASGWRLAEAARP